MPLTTWARQPGYIVFFLAVATTGGRVRSYVRGGEPSPRKREWSDHVVFMVRYPWGSYILTPLVSLEVATPEIKSKIIRRCHPYARKSASQAVLSRMQLTLHGTRRTYHGASPLVLAMFVWWVKTRRAPSRHCRNARVYGHATSAMHQNEYPPLRKLDNQRTVLLLFSGGRHGWRSS